MLRPLFRFAAALLLTCASSGSSYARGFLPPVNYGLGTAPEAVAVGDVNGDGKPDLAVVGSKSDTVSVFLGKGDGTLGAPRTFGTGVAPSAVATADLNGDGYADIVVANGGDGTISVLLSEGQNFQKAVSYGAGVQSPVSLVAADLNHDGKLDIAVAEDCSGCRTGFVGVLLGNGDGTLQPVATYVAGQFLVSLAVSDLNGDGKLDLVAADFLSSVSVLLGNGDGTFQPAMSFSLSDIPRSVALGDLNNDGKVDLVISSARKTISLFLGNGDGTFQSPVNYAVGDFPESVSLADLNGDGNLDIAVAIGSSKGGVTVLLGKGDGTFPMVHRFGAGPAAVFVAVGDFNHDRALDLVTADFAANTVSVLMNSGGTFVTTTSSQNPAPVGQPITFSATVAPSLVSTIPSGTVTFADGATILASVPLDQNGQASLTTSSLSLGTHTIRTKYSGDANFNPNTGKAITQIIQ
jgi:hypothetical protein